MSGSVLVGDVGGTNVRFAVSDGAGGFRDMVAWKANRFATFGEALAAYLDRLDDRPERAAMAVAAPVVPTGTGGPVRFTNLDWDIDAGDMARRFSFRSFDLLNDAAAIALGTTALSGRHIEQIGGGTPVHAPRVLVAPGTGLGVGVAVPAGEGWMPLGSEGGHVALASETPDGDAVVARLREWFGRASVERALSGPGIANIYEALRSREGAPEDAVMVSPESVTKRLDMKLGDPVAETAAGLFTDFLGGFCGDMVLAHDARGGVYLCGGAFEALYAHMDRDRLRRAFEAKGRFADRLRAVPMFRVRHDSPALLGLDVYMRAKTYAKT